MSTKFGGLGICIYINKKAVGVGEKNWIVYSNEKERTRTTCINIDKSQKYNVECKMQVVCSV